LTLLEHVRSHTASLLNRLDIQVRLAAAKTDEESVHDLRVAIRRLRECLRTFEDLFPAAARKNVRKELRKLMKSAERVRSTDIALELLKKAGMGESAAHMMELREQRALHCSALREELKAVAGRSDTRTWHEALGL
jgi:CHAD domain-containing protein